MSECWRQVILNLTKTPKASAANGLNSGQSLPMHTTALVLFSGGQNSTTCLAHALTRYERVETIAFDDFIACAGEAGAKEKGKMRLEGKDYLVKDGDVMHFRFNV